MWVAFLVLGALVIAPATINPAQSETEFTQWVRKIWPVARNQGISKEIFDRAFEGVAVNPEVQVFANHQPEFVMPVWEYLDQAVSPERINKGRDLLRAHDATLSKLEKRFGVDRHILVAIWGIESDYGTTMGEMSVIQSLATLAFQGRRRTFGFDQLMGALKILQRGDVGVDHFLGSWAGAMGQTQFIPTTYNAYAVDIDGDGKRNVWASVPDALGSTANYLKVSQWQRGALVVREVTLPHDFDFKNAGRENIRDLAQWARLGVVDARAQPLPSGVQNTAIILPAGAHGPAFMVFDNFRSILKYNNATSYALAVSLLALRFKGEGEIIHSWPLENLPLNSADSKELQRLLSRLGHKVGEIDGRVGVATIKAIKAYQSSKGIAADGYPSAALLNHLRKG